MARRLIESLSGVGEVYAGDLLLRAGAPYTLSLWSDDEVAHSESTQVAIEGSIDVTGMGEAVVLSGPENLTLKLQDGRRLAFTLASTGGRIVGRGGLDPK